MTLIILELQQTSREVRHEVGIVKKSSCENQAQNEKKSGKGSRKGDVNLTLARGLPTVQPQRAFCFT